MWLKRNTDGSYVNVHTNALLSVNSTGGGYGIFANNTGSAIANGFATQQDAQDTLDSFMNEQGYETIANGS